MIVCSCNLITCEDLRRAVESIRSATPDVVLNATTIYKALGKRPKCGNCLDLADEQVCALAGRGACCLQQPGRRSTPAPSEHPERPVRTAA